MRALRSPRALAAGFVLYASLLTSVIQADAQQPTIAGTLSGVVIDAATRTPVQGAFLSVGERGPRAISDSTGAFRLPAVPGGDQTILVRRFGYLDLSLGVFVGGSTATLRVILQPEPIRLEGVVASGVAEVALSGTVTNAKDGSAIPWASLTLSRDAVRKEGAASSDPQGIFRIDDVETGPYFLRVQALGYKSQYVMMDVTAPPRTVDVALEPDSVIQKGLVRFERSLKERRNYFSGINRAFGQDLLHYSAAPSASAFLETDAHMGFVPCPGGAGTFADACIVSRGQVIEPAVYIDELPIMGGLEVLSSYHPSEFHSIEVFGQGATIRAYTYAFVERTAVRPRAFLVPELRLRGEMRAPAPRGGGPD